MRQQPHQGTQATRPSAPTTMQHDLHDTHDAKCTLPGNTTLAVDAAQQPQQHALRCPSPIAQLDPSPVKQLEGKQLAYSSQRRCKHTPHNNCVTVQP